MEKIEHIGIAVKDIKQANERYAKILGRPPYKEEAVESEGVKTSFFQAGPNKIELLEASDPESPIARYIAKKGEGIHHIAFAVSDIHAELERLRGEGFEPLGKAPRPGADDKLVAFLHPRDGHGVLIELCQDR